MEPFMKAVGGKSWLAEDLVDEIADLYPSLPRLYVEPFVGGGAVALQLPPSLPKLIADANPAVVAVWAIIRDEKPERLLSELDALYKLYPNSAEGYAKARDELNGYLEGNERPEPSVRFAALTLYITARCYNGLWRVNKDGGFNVPWGKSKAPRRLMLSELRIYQEILSKAETVCADFREVLASLVKRPRADRPFTVIFADPPYDGMFADYTAGGFDEQDQRDLSTWLKYCADLGMKVIATNSDTPLIRSLYAWAKIDGGKEQHTVGPRQVNRRKADCLIIRSY